MSYTKYLEYKTTFDDQDVSMKMKRWTRGAYMELAPLMIKARDVDNEIEGNLLAIELSDAMVKNLPDHIEDFKGPKDDDGNRVSLKEVIDDVYFLPLVNEIVNQMTVISYHPEIEGDGLKK